MSRWIVFRFDCVGIWRILFLAKVDYVLSGTNQQKTRLKQQDRIVPAEQHEPCCPYVGKGCVGVFFPALLRGIYGGDQFVGFSQRGQQRCIAVGISFVDLGLSLGELYGFADQFVGVDQFADGSGWKSGMERCGCSGASNAAFLPNFVATCQPSGRFGRRRHGRRL